MDPYHPPPLPWFSDVSFCTFHGLNDHHASESDADGTVVASGIVARLQITHQLLNGHRTSTHNLHKLNKWLSTLDGCTLTHMELRRNNSLRMGPNLTYTDNTLLTEALKKTCQLRTQFGVQCLSFYTKHFVEPL